METGQSILNAITTRQIPTLISYNGMSFKNLELSAHQHLLFCLYVCVFMFGLLSKTMPHL